MGYAYSALYSRYKVVIVFLLMTKVKKQAQYAL